MKTLETEQDFIEAFESHNLRLIFGNLSACAQAIKTRAKWGKTEFNYSFHSPERMIQFLNEYLAKLQTRIDRRIEAKEKKKLAKSLMGNPYSIGDILYNSWGYDQTNIDFYQVVETTPKSILLRPIAQQTRNDLGKGLSSMAEYVEPVKDCFLVGKPERKILQSSINSDGTLWIYIHADHGSFGVYSKPLYQSHYA